VPGSLRNKWAPAGEDQQATLTLLRLKEPEVADVAPEVVGGWAVWVRGLHLTSTLEHLLMRSPPDALGPLAEHGSKARVLCTIQVTQNVSGRGPDRC
jgi:hypothetical protein